MADAGAFQPLMPEERVLGPLLDLAGELITCSLRLAEQGSIPLRTSLAGPLRAMNSYYTNKIEGQHTLPADIERAIRREFDADLALRRKQQIALAHMESEEALEHTTQAIEPRELFASDPVRAIHAALWSTPPPVSFAGKPVYVLTSERTFSGGEEFAYDMQVMGLGVLVGETTGGGANPGGGAPLAAGLSMFVPGGRAENPITGTNWEGVGVMPDIETPSAEALRVALERLGESPASTEIDALSEARVFEPRSTPQPGSEAAIRRLSDELARGEPDYDLLAPGLADATRTQLESLHQRFSELGPIESVTFVEVDAMGGNVYDVEYENGALTWMIALAPDGKTLGAGFRPSAPQ